MFLYNVYTSEDCIQAWIHALFMKWFILWCVCCKNPTFLIYCPRTVLYCKYWNDVPHTVDVFRAIAPDYSTQFGIADSFFFWPSEVTRTADHLYCTCLWEWVCSGESAATRCNEEEGYLICGTHRGGEKRPVTLHNPLNVLSTVFMRAIRQEAVPVKNSEDYFEITGILCWDNSINYSTLVRLCQYNLHTVYMPAVLSIFFFFPCACSCLFICCSLLLLHISTFIEEGRGDITCRCMIKSKNTQVIHLISQHPKKHCEVRETTYLLATGLSLICMVLSSWLFVLGRLKLLFFLWRREQHEPRPCGDEDTEEVREPDLFITETSMQFAWKVCSSTNSWFWRRKKNWIQCCLWITLLHRWLALLNDE